MLPAPQFHSHILPDQQRRPLKDNALQRHKMVTRPIIGVRSSIGINIDRLFFGGSEVNTDKPESLQWRFKEAVKPSRLIFNATSSLSDLGFLDPKMTFFPAT
jgi:hypothetical protein